MPWCLLLPGPVVAVFDFVGQLTFVDVVAFDTTEPADVRWRRRLFGWLLLLFPLWLLSLTCGDGRHVFDGDG